MLDFLLKNILYLWLLVIIVSSVIEAFTLDLSAIWFSVGGLFAFLAASLGLNIGAQLAVFLLFSIALLIVIRPFCQRFLRTKNEATNADRIIGSIGIVQQDIDNIQETGEIKVMGQFWTARSAENDPIVVGSQVRVVDIQGVKAIVKLTQRKEG